MKTIIKKETKYISKPQEVEVLYYVTNDGREFLDKEDALAVDKLNSIPKKAHTNSHTSRHYGSWYYFKSIEELAMVVPKEVLESEIEDETENLIFPSWLLVTEDEDYSYNKTYYYLHTVDKIREDLMKSLNEIPE